MISVSNVYHSIESYVNYILSENKLIEVIHDSTKHDSNEESFSKMYHWKCKLQCLLNLKTDCVYYKLCEVKFLDEIQTQEPLNLMIPNDDNLIETASNYYFYFSALKEREDRELYSNDKEDTHFTCEYCDYENELDAESCSICESVMDYSWEKNNKKSVDRNKVLTDLVSMETKIQCENIENISPDLSLKEIVDHLRYDSTIAGDFDSKTKLKSLESGSSKSNNSSTFGSLVNEITRLDNYSDNVKKDSNEPLWHCNKCSFANEINQTNCKVCLETWKCRHCSFVNKKSSRECSACKQSLSFGDKKTLFKWNTPESKQLSMNKWKCNQCGYMDNCANQLNCKVCLEEISENSKWICNSCTFEQEIGVERCTLCGTVNEISEVYRGSEKMCIDSRSHSKCIIS